MLPRPELNKYKLAHIRVLPTCLVYLMAGILSATVDVWWITLLISLFVIALTLVMIFTLTRRRVLAVVCLLLFVLGAATCFHSALAVHRRIQPLPENTYLRGTVVGFNIDGEGRILSLTFDDLYQSDRPLAGKATVSLEQVSQVYVSRDALSTAEGIAIGVGDVLFAYGAATHTRVDFFDSYLLHRIVNRQYYHVDATSLYILGSLPIGGVQVIRENLYYALVSNAPIEVAGLGYGLLTGDPARMPDEVVNGFRFTGTAHLLTVSGMNVSAFAVVLSWILKKCRVPAVLRLIPLSVTLGLYCWFCGFAPSVLRAALVLVGASVAQALGARSDAASNVSLSAILLLIINPLWLFDVSFLLSYGAYLGIVFLFPVFAKLLRKIPRFLADSLALNLSVTLAVTPISLYFFGGVSALSPLINFLIIPIFTFLYFALFVVVVVVMLLPNLGILLSCLGVLMEWIQIALMHLGNWGYLRIGYQLFCLPLFWTGLWMLSDYCLWRGRIKYPVGSTVCGLSLALGLGLSA